MKITIELQVEQQRSDSGEGVDFLCTVQASAGSSVHAKREFKLHEYDYVLTRFGTSQIVRDLAEELRKELYALPIQNEFYGA